MRIGILPPRALLSSAAGAGVLLLVYAVAAWWLASSGPWTDDAASSLSIHPQARMNAVLALLLLFTHLASYSETEATGRDLERLAPHLDMPPQAVAALAEHRQRVSAASVLVLVAGAGFGVLLDLTPGLFAGERLFVTPLQVLRLVLMAGLFAALAGRARQTFASGRIFSEVGRDHVRVSLFNPEPLQVFGRRGLRLALNWFVGSAFASLLVLDARSPAIVAGVIALTLTLGGVSLVAPSMGVHRVLRDRKREELRRVRAAIERGGRTLLSEPTGAGSEGEAEGPEAAQLPALIAYEERLSAVREWPFDTPTLVRFTALAVLATGSWLGGALVERVLSAWWD